MSKTAMILALVMAFACGAVAQTYTVDRDSDELREIDPATGLTLNSVTMTPALGNGYTALSVDPTTGTFYVVENTGSTRTLKTVDPVTGVTTVVGSVASLAGITFDASGVLYGIEGENNTPGNLVQLNTATGASTLLASLGNAGGDGEEIAVSPFDGLIYRIDSEQLSSIDPNAGFAVTNIATLGTGVGGISEVTGMAFDASGDLLVSDLGDDLFRVTTAGVETLIGPLGYDDHGIDQPGLFGPPLMPTYPGTGEDFVTSSSMNGGNYITASNLLNDSVGLNVGDTIAVRHASPGGTFNFTELLAFATIAPIGTPAIQVFPGLHLLNGGGIFLTIGGGIPGAPLSVAPGGNTFGGVHIGGALIGQSVLVEGVALTSTAANAIFASANGLLINFN